MRRLTFIVIALAVLYSGYWFVGATATEKAATTRLADLNAAGWNISYDDLSTAGYPSRFDTTLTNLQATSGDGRVAWAIPMIQALSLSYQPNQVILVLADSQQITLNGTLMDVASDGLRASVTVAPSTNLNPTDVTFETGPLDVTVAGDPLLTMTKGIAAMRLAGPAPHHYDTYLDLDGLALPPALRRLIDPNGTLPATFDQVTIDGAVTLDGDLSASPRPTALSLNGMTITLGVLQLRGKGALTVDSSGIPSGKIDLTAQNWRQMLDLAAGAGLVDLGIANTIKNMGGLLGGGGTDISIPLTFQNGMMSAGPLPLGQAPRLF